MAATTLPVGLVTPLLVLQVSVVLPVLVPNVPLLGVCVIVSVIWVFAALTESLQVRITTLPEPM